MLNRLKNLLSFWEIYVENIILLFCFFNFLDIITTYSVMLLYPDYFIEINPIASYMFKHNYHLLAIVGKLSIGFFVISMLVNLYKKNKTSSIKLFVYLYLYFFVIVVTNNFLQFVSLSLRLFIENNIINFIISTALVLGLQFLIITYISLNRKSKLYNKI